MKGSSTAGGSEPNAYYHETPMPWYRVVQIVLMSVTIAPIRLLLLILTFLAMGVITTVAGSGLPLHRTTPLSGWRKKANAPLKFLLYCMFFFAGFHRIKTRGKLASAAEAALLVGAPHTSFMDVVCGLVGGIHAAVSIMEHASAPVIGKYFKISQMIFVDRRDPNSRENTMRLLQMRARSGGRWGRTVVFPEGTCTSGAAVIPYKRGAFAPGEPVQPILMYYHNSWNTYAWPPEGTWVVWQLWMTLCQFHNSCTLEYLPVYTPSVEEKADPGLYADNVRDLMAKALKLPLTEQTYSDYKRMKRAAKEEQTASGREVEATGKDREANGLVQRHKQTN